MMEMWLWLCMAVPVMIVGEIFHFKCKLLKLGKWNIPAKCTATWMAVWTAVTGYAGSGRPAFFLLVIGALVLFLAADALLEIHFYSGMAAFGAGHVLLLIWLFGETGFHWGMIPVWAVLMVFVVGLFRGELREGKERPAMYLMLLYPAVLMAMVTAAVWLPAVGGASYLTAAAGAVLFAASDMMVGKQFFRPLPKAVNVLALTMYYAGILCLALVCWQGGY